MMAQKYIYTVYGYMYDPKVRDPDSTILPKSPFEEIPEEWEYQECGVSKEHFEPYKED